MIKIKTFVFNAFSVNSFVIYDTEEKECIIVDPGCIDPSEQNTLTQFIKDEQLKPTKLINTHCHVDHVAGNKFVVDTYNIPVYANDQDNGNLSDSSRAGELYGMIIDTPPAVHQNLESGDIVKLGNAQLEVMNLPGHSKGSIALHAREEKFVVVGDVLFNGSVGRTDLNGGSLDELMDSIKNVLFKLDDDVVVHPGHGPETNIGNELRSNPFLLDNVM